MKALCLGLGDDAALLKGGWLTLHREYDVLAILASPGRTIEFRVLADDGRTPILADSRLFAATAQPVPGSWVCTVSEDGVVELGPSAWLEEGFWERYFDGDPDAVECFRTGIGAPGG
jgi:hypothetical protein